MTLFINNRAGDRVHAPQSRSVPLAAVWEPSGFNEGTAAERSVRTLRPLDRTQHRVPVAERPRSRDTWQERGRRRRDTWMTYLIGALFGTVLVGASVLGDTGDGVPPAEFHPVHGQVVSEAR